MKEHKRIKRLRNHLLELHKAAENKTSTISKNSTTQKPLNATTSKNLTTNATNSKSPSTSTTTTSKVQNSTTTSKPQANTTKPTNGTAVKPNNTTAVTQKNCTVNSSKNGSKSASSTCEQPKSSINIPWVPILCVLASIGLIIFIIWLIRQIKRRIETTKKYNQTPEHFIQNPNLSLNQQKNLKLHKVQRFKYYSEKDCVVEEKNEYGGSIYELAFMNQYREKFSAAYWNKVIKTDCYFEVEIDTLDSEIEFGFVGAQYFGQLNDGIETKISRVGVSINSEGNLQVYGQIKYQYRWALEYGDVVGMGMTNIEGNKRVWITKNGILLNPPTSDEVQKWLTKEQLSTSHRDAYTNFNETKRKNLNKKQDNDLLKRKVSLPAAEDFKYYAVVGSWAVTGNQLDKSKKFTNKLSQISQSPCTKVRVNVGGKVFRLRDHNLKSGLLADPLEKNQFCNWLPCF